MDGKRPRRPSLFEAHSGLIGNSMLAQCGGLLNLCELGIMALGVETWTAIAATPDQRFPALACRAANWRHLAVSAAPTAYVGVMALYKTL